MPDLIRPSRLTVRLAPIVVALIALGMMSACRADAPTAVVVRSADVVVDDTAMSRASVAQGALGTPRPPIGRVPTTDPKNLPPYFPPLTGSRWDTIAPVKLGYDTAAFRSALDWAGTQQSTAVVVLWRGRIVAERYWRGWTITKDSIIASATKSVVSSIIGELARQRRLSPDSAVSKYLGTGWSRSQTSESRITVRHLLGMMSGLDDSLKFVAQPGTRFYYNTPAYHQLDAVVQGAMGQGLPAVARSVLFDRIGMNTANWKLFIDTGEPGLILSCSARDMARFGLLALNRGRWNGTPILADSAWFSTAWHQVPPDNAGYGMLWWLNGSTSYRIPGPYLLPTFPGPLFPSAPKDLVAALGKGDKKIYVIPSLELVVVRHGDEADPNGGNPAAASAFDEQWWSRLKLAFRY
jgi:CubicO group peptidase (beta-lactamase class C family)